MLHLHQPILDFGLLAIITAKDLGFIDNEEMLEGLSDFDLVPWNSEDFLHNKFDDDLDLFAFYDEDAEYGQALHESTKNK